MSEEQAAPAAEQTNEATETVAQAEATEKKGRSMKTKLFALIFGPEGKVQVVESESYKDLKAQIKAMGEVKVQKVLRGREIPVRTETNMKFF